MQRRELKAQKDNTKLQQQQQQQHKKRRCPRLYSSTQEKAAYGHCMKTAAAGRASKDYAEEEED